MTAYDRARDIRKDKARERLITIVQNYGPKHDGWNEIVETVFGFLSADDITNVVNDHCDPEDVFDVDTLRDWYASQQ